METIDGNNSEVQLSDEHTELAWVDKNEIEDEKYQSLQSKTQYRTTKYLNSPGYPLSLRDSPCNIIEQDHRFIKNGKLLLALLS